MQLEGLTSKKKKKTSKKLAELCPTVSPEAAETGLNLGLLSTP